MKRRRRGRGADARGRSVVPDAFLKLDHWIMRTPAWASLSGNSIKVLLAVAMRHDGHNNGRIVFGVRSGIFVRSEGAWEEVSLGLSRSSVARALEELHERGFLVLERNASFHQKRLLREWRVTFLPTEGEPPTRDFARWRPLQAQKPVPPAGQYVSAVGQRELTPPSE
jgi:hypothetical protein